MYQQLQMLAQHEQIEKITMELVKIPSVNGTRGETTIAHYIKGLLESIPYFQQHPTQLWEQPLENDPLGRRNVFALVKGQKESSTRTIIFHAHSDTVGVEDFGSQRDKAFNPEELLQFFQQYSNYPQVQNEALSGEWMFGRGACDMKSGIAVHVTNLLYFIEHIEQLAGNILFMVNPVEENEHTGIIEAIQELERLKREAGLEFVLAINTDFVSPLYDGDPHRYIYTGSVGKLLPSFFITGREAHVGQTLTGIDATLISAEINRRINNNMELAEDIEGELVLPASCLLQRDQKEFYNVQTAGKAALYFNYFIYKSSPEEVIKKLKQVTEQACAGITSYLASEYAEFTQRTKLPASNLSWDIEVISLEEFIEQLEVKGINTNLISANIVEKNSELEPRTLCYKIVEALHESDPDKRPRVIIYFAPPYCPHNYLLENNERDQALLVTLENILAEMSNETGEKFSLKKFFPYLSDSSYLSLHDTDEEISALINNFPEWDSIYPVPVKKIRALNIPSINMGVYGKDAHQWTERVYKPYSFEVLPQLIRKTTLAILRGEQD